MPKSNSIRPVGIGVGTSSLLLIFVLLGMTVLALLSFKVAQSDQRIDNRIRAGMQSYYEAQREASGQLSIIDGMLSEERRAALSNEGYFQSSAPQLLALGLEDQGDNLYTFRIPIDNSRALDCGIRILPMEEALRYVIVYERSVVTADWVPDQDQNVWLP